MKSSLDTSLLASLLKEHKTPFYFYSRKTLENTINEIKNAFAIEDFQLLFALLQIVKFLRFVRADASKMSATR